MAGNYWDSSNNVLAAPPTVTPPSMMNYGNYNFGGAGYGGQFTADPAGAVRMQNGAGSQWFNNSGSTSQQDGFGFNSNTIGMVMGGLQALGSLWNSYNQQKLAKEQFKFQKQAWQTNLANQTKTYNTALEDRIRARHFTEGKSAKETNDYIATHRL